MNEPDFDARFRDRFEMLLRWRRDVRHFDPRAIPQAEMAAILDSAAFAPSVGNSQPWRFVRCMSDAVRASLAEHVDDANAIAGRGYADAERARTYAGLKLHGLREAPEILAVFTDDAPLAGHRLGRATMPETLRYSTVMAIHTMWLVARSRGIGLGWVSILEPETIARLLDVPAPWGFVALLCLGYPEQASDMPELERRDWQAREPIADRIVRR